MWKRRCPSGRRRGDHQRRFLFHRARLLEEGRHSGEDKHWRLRQRSLLTRKSRITSEEACSYYHQEDHQAGRGPLHFLIQLTQQPGSAKPCAPRR